MRTRIVFNVVAALAVLAATACAPVFAPGDVAGLSGPVFGTGHAQLAVASKR